MQVFQCFITMINARKLWRPATLKSLLATFLCDSNTNLLVSSLFGRRKIGENNNFISLFSPAPQEKKNKTNKLVDYSQEGLTKKKDAVMISVKGQILLISIFMCLKPRVVGLFILLIPLV